MKYFLIFLISISIFACGGSSYSSNYDQQPSQGIQYKQVPDNITFLE
tara:strand:+ start:127 stop:267 length:141 start_codon:yes stop_codon:yes gene_type:complete